MNKVVITGLGIVNPLGNNIIDYWNALKSGLSGSSLITRFNTSNTPVKFACEIKKLNTIKLLHKKEIKLLDTSSQFGLISCEEALKDSDINLSKIDKNKIGIIWGTGIGNIHAFENEIKNKNQKNKINPFFVNKFITDSTPGLISIKYQIFGSNYTIASSCTSSSNAIINAYYLINSGEKYIVITGGSESGITKIGINSFNTMRVLSNNNNHYKEASRPFDKYRDGFVMGEGAGTIILENYKHAKLRNAKIYAEIVGFGTTSDAFHHTLPHPQGLGLKSSIYQAIKKAKINTSDINYISTHAASTIIGDIIEIKTLKNVFGKLLYNHIYISAIKSMTGHLLGASGISEAISMILSIKNNIIPPTINQNKLDEQVDDNILIIRNKAKNHNINFGMMNNIGFWGHNISIIFKKYS
jgi:3-oxoacyl-[acyl-carrier-protein] synthase II